MMPPRKLRLKRKAKEDIFARLRKLIYCALARLRELIYCALAQQGAKLMPRHTLRFLEPDRGVSSCEEMEMPSRLGAGGSHGRLLPPASTALDKFHNFTDLPAELRFAIWDLSFVPRTVELHTPCGRYEHGIEYIDSPQYHWQSRSRNPAAFSVCKEARAAAKEFYNVVIPLCRPIARNSNHLTGSEQVLYTNLVQDTITVLGETDISCVTKLMDWLKELDKPTLSGAKALARAGKGIRKLALSIPELRMGCQCELCALCMMQFLALDGGLFARGLEELVLFRHPDLTPPQEWTGGTCKFQELASGAKEILEFINERDGRAGQPWAFENIKKEPMKLAELSFEDALQ